MRARRGATGTASRRRPSAVGVQLRRPRARRGPSSKPARPLERARRRRIEPRERRRVAEAPGRELEQRAAEIDAQDLRQLVLAPADLLGARPEPDAAAGPEPAGASRALRRRRAADGAEPQPIEPRPRVEARDAREPGVDHDRHALDRERRLGDVGREHDAAARPGAERPRLLVERLIAVQRQDVDPGGRGERRERARTRGGSRRRRAGTRARHPASRASSRRTAADDAIVEPAPVAGVVVRDRRRGGRGPRR